MSEAPFRYSTLGQAPGLTHKHQPMLERLAGDKHSSLLRKSINYGRKTFHSTSPWGQASWVKMTSPRGKLTALTCHPIKTLNKAIDKLQPRGLNLGRVFNYRCGCASTQMNKCTSWKQPNLQLKTWPKKVLGSLPLAFVFPSKLIS